MRRIRVLARDLVLIGVLAGGLVALVLGQLIIGLVLCAFAVFEFTRLYRGKGGLLVDQRWAAGEGKPRLRSK